jgi:glycosyltransferase involved in cell wall biosynthesis
VDETVHLMKHVVLLRRWKNRFNPLDELIAAAGYHVTVANDDDYVFDSADILWVQGNVNWFPRAWSHLERADRQNRPFTLTWHTEPLPFPDDSGFSQPRLTLREIGKTILRDPRATDSWTNARRIAQLVSTGLLDLCVVSSRSRQSYLRQKRIPSEFVPLGYDPRMGRDLGAERDIDVLFIGTLDDARHRKAIRFIRSSGIEVHAAGSWTSDAFWGDSRTTLINRAKIFLNVQRHPGQYSGLRMLLGMGNRSMVLSEPVHDPFPYEPGVHYVSTALEQMPETILKYLSDDSARAAVADAGYDFVTTQLRMEKSVAAILDHVNRLQSQ